MLQVSKFHVPIVFEVDRGIFRLLPTQNRVKDQKIYTRCIWNNVTFSYTLSQVFKVLQNIWNLLSKNKPHNGIIYEHHVHPDTLSLSSLPSSSPDCLFVTSFWQISASPRQLHIRLQATLAEAHKHCLVLQELEVLQSHIAISRTSPGAAARI